MRGLGMPASRRPCRRQTRIEHGRGNLSEYDMFYISEPWRGPSPYPASARFAASAKNPEA